MKWTPLSLQKDALDFIMNTPKTALLASPGLGKTAVVLTAIKTLLARRPEKKVLIVLTKKVLDSEGWPREVLKWDHLNGMKITPIVGTPAERAAVLADLPTITCINYELLPWLLELTAAKWPWNLVVCDESQKLKGYDGRWFSGKLVQYEKDVITGKRKKVADAKPGLIHVAPKTERWINMSGTPSPHSITDMWSQTHLLDGGRRLGHNITAFRNNWMRQGRDGFSWEAQPGAAEEIGTAVSDICLSIKARDYLDLPELVSNVVDIVMPPKIKAQYRFLEDEFFAKLKDGEVIEAANAAVLSGKCMQHCLAEGSLVLTDSGWKRIEKVLVSDQVFDGHEWCAHGGVIEQGERETIDLFGVWMTPDHRVLTTSGWKQAKEILNGESSEGLNWASVWASHGATPRRDCDIHGRQEKGNKAVPTRAANPGSNKTCIAKTYDITNVGKRNQFVVIGAEGVPLIVHNCNGFLYREDQTWEDIHDTKLDALEDLLDEVGGPAIVTYQYKADLARILKRFKKAVVFDGSKGCIKAFAEGKIRTLLLHPGSAAEGVDGLQDGTDTIVFYSMTWNAGQHDQVIERIGPTRQLQSGHPRPVFVHYLATRGTVDMLALKRVKDKQTMQEILTQAMKERK